MPKLKINAFTKDTDIVKFVNAGARSDMDDPVELVSDDARFIGQVILGITVKEEKNV